MNFLLQKTYDFSQIMVCPHEQGISGLRQCGHFTDKGEKLIFCDFLRTCLIGCL